VYPDTESFFLNTHDHLKIHCYWIKSKPDQEPEEDDEILSEEHPGPVMIFCGPNANYAEQLQYNQDFLDFYLDNGISVVTFNYRGFGLSEGMPSIPLIRQDAEVVANYVRSVVGPNARIGTHG